MAFGLTSIFSYSARETACARMDSELKSGTNSEMTKCVNNPDMETPIGDTIGFAVISALIQLLFDQFGNFVVSCACVQTCPKWIKSCAEGFGKMVFCVLGLVAITFFISGITFVVRMGGDAGVSLITFVVIRFSNFFVITSATQLVMFALARRGQMKPAAEVLATEAGKKKWENPAGCLPCCPCCMKRAPCELWNKFHGEDKHFADLPAKPFDYDYELKISWCLFFCTNTCFKVKAKNPMPEDIKDPPVCPAQLEMGDAGGAVPQQQQQQQQQQNGFCKACGAPKAASAAFCTSCGAGAPAAPAADSGDTVDPALPAACEEYKDAEGMTAS